MDSSCRLNELAVDAKTEQTTKMFLARVAEHYELRAAYLFGSRARRMAGPESDADIAVLLNGPRGSRADTAVDMAGIAFDVM
jgi:predicted nucleotidyltransferase